MEHRTTIPALELNNVTAGYQDTCILKNVTVRIEQGLLCGVVGPNGAGKTTLIKSVLNSVPLSSGSISVLGQQHTHATSSIAYVPQRTAVDWNFPTTVFDAVLMGTYGTCGWFKRPGKHERELTDHALHELGIHRLANRPINELSGGQQQRVFLARALVQQAPIYMMDEPFNGIDGPTEQIIISILKRLQKEGKTIVVVHHDLQTLAEQFDYILLLNQKTIAYGKTRDVLVPQYICAAYGNKTIFSDSQFGTT